MHTVCFVQNFIIFFNYKACVLWDLFRYTQVGLNLLKLGNAKYWCSCSACLIRLDKK